VYIHEYQAKAMLAGRGVPVPAGRMASSPEAAARAYEEMRLHRAVVKAQIHAGGRGKAGGILTASSRAECESAARRLLGTTLVTAQTGPRGRPVDKVLVQEHIEIKRELYLGLLIDRQRGCPMALGSAQGGTEIESAAETPSAVVRVYGNPYTGLEPFQARDLCAGMGLGHESIRPMTDVVMALARLFIECDCSLTELNPLALCPDGRLLAADVKMTLDDNALFRHPDLCDLRDPAQEDPREVEARRHDLNYVGLDGNIGCMVNGAGLAMATMDLIRLSGGEPANFLDVGGDATVERVVAAFRLLCSDPRVKAILVNIFGGIVRCDLIAQGIVQAVERAGLALPLVVRLEGTKAEEGRALLSASGLKIVSADLLDEAARKAVELAQR
jgi:succinyl-CoA synthetase beta subunit